MKKWIVLLFALSLYARMHKVQLQPYEIYSLKAAVAAQVLDSRIDLEGSSVHDSLILHLDDRLDQESLRRLNAKKKNLSQIIATDKEQLETLQKIASIKRRDYERIKDLATKSLVEKERRLSDYLGAKRAALAQKAQLQSHRSQLQDIELSIARTKDAIQKKRIKVSGYLYKIYVKKGDFVNPGTLMAQVADTSRAKAVLYLSREELKDLKKKAIYIDGKRTDLRFSKILKIPDTTHLGEYRAELVLPAPKIFGKFITVEIK